MPLWSDLLHRQQPSVRQILKEVITGNCCVDELNKFAFNRRLYVGLQFDQEIRLDIKAFAYIQSNKTGGNRAFNEKLGDLGRHRRDSIASGQVAQGKKKR
jgi:hypothetical protein